METLYAACKRCGILLHKADKTNKYQRLMRLILEITDKIEIYEFLKGSVSNNLCQL